MNSGPGPWIPPPQPPYWSVPKTWPGQTIFILAGGPSLSGMDIDRLKGCPTIVINRSFRLALWADVLYFCDKHYYVRDGEEIRNTFTGRWVITCSRTMDPGVKVIRNTGTAGLETSPAGVKHGTNSGYQAINLAFHFGVSRIVLLGYDMKVAGATTHAHGGYGLGAAQMQHVLQQRMLPFFDRLVKPLADHGVEVLNGYPDSALECWPKIEPARVYELADAQRLAYRT